MNKEQLQDLHHVMWEAENLGKLAAKVRRQIAADQKSGQVALVEIDRPDDPELHRLQGDASKSDSDYFRVRYETGDTGTVINIDCPTLLRGRLRLHVRKDGSVSAAY